MISQGDEMYEHRNNEHQLATRIYACVFVA